MDIADEFSGAARWIGQAGNEALDAAFAVPHRALRDAVHSLAPAWSGSWRDGYAALYDRQLRALPPQWRLHADSDPALPPPELLQRCRVWTPQQIHDVVHALANHPQSSDVHSRGQLAQRKFKDAVSCCDALLDRLAARPGHGSETCALAAALARIAPPSRDDILGAWAPRPPRPAATTTRSLDAPPPHLAMLADLEAMLGPFDALRKLSNLMRYAAARVATPPRWRAGIDLHRLARQVELNAA